MNICVTGYFGSGSSACLDYLSELDNTFFLNRSDDYEHSLFYIGNGLFELYETLYADSSNYLTRSHALNDFYDLSLNQYKTNYGWYGSYKRLVGKEFVDILNEFFNSISKQQEPANDIADCTGVYYSPFKAVLQIGASILMDYHIAVLGRQYKRKRRPFRYITVDKDGFESECRSFLDEYARICNLDRKPIAVFDHLISAEQVYGVRNLIPDDYKIIIVDRNPVDSYLIAKKIWSHKKQGYTAPVPLDVNEFCKNYKYQRRNILHTINMENVLYIYFEELVLNYEEITNRINSFIGSEAMKINTIKKRFNPEISINNINLGSVYSDESENINYIINYFTEDVFGRRFDYFTNYNNNKSSVF